MKTYVISMPHSKERREYINSILEDIEFDFFDGISPSDKEFEVIKKLYSPENTKKYKGYYLTDGELGCFASHYFLWKKCVELDEPILILEDNIEVNDNFLVGINLSPKLIEKYKIIKIANSFKQKYIFIERINDILSIISFRRVGAGTQGYYISPEIANVYLSNMKDFYEPVDNYMEKEWFHKVIVYSLWPNIVNRKNTKSVIGQRKVKLKLPLHEKLLLEIRKGIIKLKIKAFSFKKKRMLGKTIIFKEEDQKK